MRLSGAAAARDGHETRCLPRRRHRAAPRGLRRGQRHGPVAGLLYADTDIPTHERKQAHYARVQELAHRFQSAHGSYLCRDLLAGVETMPGGAPEARTAQYYAKRPCAGLCESAAALFDAYVQENPPEKQP